MKTAQHELFVYFGVSGTSKPVKDMVQWIEEKGWKVVKGKKSDNIINTLAENPFAIAILPYETNDCSSIKDLYEIKMKYPELSVMYFSENEIEYEHLVYALNEGADGFLSGKLDKTKTMTVLERKVSSHMSHAKLVNKAQSLERQLHQLERETVAIKTMAAEMGQKLTSLTLVINDMLSNSELYLGSKKVLVVSDSNYQKNVISNSLREKNIQPVLVSSKKEALEQAKTMSPLVVVSDYELDDGTGKDLATEMKSDPEIKNPYIIICSAATNLRDELLSPTSPVDDFLCKESLNELISSVVIAYYTIKQRASNYSN